MDVLPSANYSITVRLEIRNKPGMLGAGTRVGPAAALPVMEGIPSVFNKAVAGAVAAGVARAAQATGVARRRRRLDLSGIQ